jgi:NAD(P)-dependent dehydrogenase (short-subunit alcohol dehydrogenase family)
MKGVAGKVAVVTGGASGIGRALCEELARRHAVVIVADLNAGAADRVAQALTDAGGRASAAGVDVARAESVQELVRATLARHGRIDLMFNNAGVAWGGDIQGMALADLDRIVGINLNGVLYGASAVYPAMVKQGAGHIVNMAALTGLVPGPGSTIYAATKHGVVGFSQSLRGEAQAFGVRVSVVCPGFVNTNLTRNSDSILKGQVDSHSAPMSSQRLNAPTCARAILDGVARNRAIIVVPLYARLSWRLFRVSPTLYHAIVRPLVMSKMRPDQTSRPAAMCSSTARWLARSLMRLR